MNKKAFELEQINTRLDNTLTVGKLIALLQQYPQHMYVGAIGHYGEFHGLVKNDLSAQPECQVYATISVWRSDARVDLTGKVLTIDWPDIGPDPD